MNRNDIIREDQSRNGVRVIVHRWKDSRGTTVESDCNCLGLPMRAHSNMECPMLKKAMKSQPQA